MYVRTNFDRKNFGEKSVANLLFEMCVLLGYFSKSDNLHIRN